MSNRYIKEKNKNILILGYGKTGKSIASFLKNKNYNIYLWDDDKKVLDNIGNNFFIYNQQKLNIFESIFVSPGISKSHTIIKNAIKNKIKISSDIELFLNELKKQDKKNLLLAVTGTNGKSTIALMIANVLKVKPLANFGNLVLENFPYENDDLILELSSFQLEYLNSIKPKVSIISNIRKDHISYHGSYENYKKAKLKICYYQDKKDFIILNYDDNYLRKTFLNKSITEASIVWVSIQKKIKGGVSYMEDSLYDDYFTKKKYEIKKNNFLNLSHNKLNFITSYSAMKCLNNESDKTLKALSAFQGLPHRLEYLGEINNISFYNDSKATNVSATCSALESFNKVFLIAGGSSKGTSFNSLKKYSAKIYEAYLIGETAKELYKVLKSFCKSFICCDLEEAVKRSYKQSLATKKNYPILLSPASASFDQYQNYESRGKHFKKIFNKISNESLL